MLIQAWRSGFPRASLRTSSTKGLDPFKYLFSTSASHRYAHDGTTRGSQDLRKRRFRDVSRNSHHRSNVSTERDFQRIQGSSQHQIVVSHPRVTLGEPDESSGHASSKILANSDYFRIADEVREALENNRPIVALESTIYTHGLPYPDNIALAIELEGILRNNGVTPATIGFLNGVATIGLSPTEISELSSSAGDPNTMKVSRRDMPYIIGMGLAGRKIHGGTTVAATMYLAELAGIKVFATGGIGGVHRGGEDTMDVSADLNELGRTSMCVIASGCKSFLDIPRTLEYLETQGVTVATYSDNGARKVPFPAFYTRDSGVPSPLVVGSSLEAASIIHAQSLLGHDYGSGFLLANPIPEDFAVPKESIDAAINAAITEATAQGIRGHANTPFILAHIKNVTAGKSVIANRALIKSNVKLAAEVIKSYHDLIPETDRRALSGASRENNKQSQDPTSKAQLHSATASTEIEGSAPSTVKVEKTTNINSIQQPNVDVMVYGALAVDLSCDFVPSNEAVNHVAQSPDLHTSNPASITSTLGGVGHNVALAAHRASAGHLNVRLCSFVADDFAGGIALEGLVSEGLDNSGIQVRKVTEVDKSTGETKRTNHTAQYVAVNDSKKDLVVAMADMAIFDGRTYPSRNGKHYKPQLDAATWAVVDANLDTRAIQNAVRDSRAADTKILFEPVSAYKSTKLFERVAKSQDDAEFLSCFPDHALDIATPNQYELAAMHRAASERGLFESPDWWTTIDALGIPSSGARDRFEQITNAKMTDEGIPIQTIQLLPFMPTIVTKLGPAGVLQTELLRPSDPRLTDRKHAAYILSRTANENKDIGGVYMRLYPPAEIVEDVVSVNGVGDTFVGVLVAGLASGMPLDAKLIDVAQKAAVKTLRSKESVSPDVTGILSVES